MLPGAPNSAEYCDILNLQKIHDDIKISVLRNPAVFKSVPWSSAIQAPIITSITTVYVLCHGSVPILVNKAKDIILTNYCSDNYGSLTCDNTSGGQPEGSTAQLYDDI